MTMSVEELASTNKLHIPVPKPLFVYFGHNQADVEDHYLNPIFFKSMLEEVRELAGNERMVEIRTIGGDGSKKVSGPSVQRLTDAIDVESSMKNTGSIRDNFSVDDALNDALARVEKYDTATADVIFVGFSRTSGGGCGAIERDLKAVDRALQKKRNLRALLLVDTDEESEKFRTDKENFGALYLDCGTFVDGAVSVVLSAMRLSTRQSDARRQGVPAAAWRKVYKETFPD